MDQKKFTAMQKGGQMLAEIMRDTIPLVRPGITLLAINSFVQEQIIARGASISFQTVRQYPFATCINLNAGIVHGYPNHTKIQSGDLVSIDTGLIWGGYHTDMSYSWYVDKPMDAFLKVGREALKKAIHEARTGRRIGHISTAIQTTIQGAGFAPSAHLTGHTIGKTLHERPFIPCMATEPIQSTPVLTAGTALAIEVIYSEDASDLRLGSDGWTLSTSNGKMSALFEQTVYLKDHQTVILTPYLWETQKHAK